MSIPRNTVLAFVPQGVMLLTGIVTSIVTARYLGPSGRGVLALALLALGILLLVADLGMSQALTYYVSGKRIGRSQALAFSTLAAGLLGGSAYAVALLLYPLLEPTLLQGVSLVIYSTALAAVVPMLFVQFWTRLRMAVGEFVQPAIMQSSVAIGTVLLAVMVLPVAKLGVAEFVVTLTLMHTLLAIIAFIAEVRASGWSWDFEAGFVREAGSYGLRSYIGGLVSYATLRIDAFILNAFGTNADVGRYTVAVTLGEKIWLIDSSLGQATMPEVVARDRRGAAELVAQANRMVILSATAVAVLLFVTAPWLIGLLYGEEFLAAVEPLRILLPGIVAYASGRVLLQYHIGQLGRPGAASGVMGLSAAVGITGYLTLIPRFGMNGAAWASTAAYITVFIAGIVLFMRDSHLGLGATILPRGADVRRLLQLVRDAWSAVASSSTDKSRSV